MTWTHLDDAAAKNPKAVAAGNEAWALWVGAVLYCNRYLTDGVVSLSALALECLPVQLTPQKAKKLAEQLCESKAKPDGAGLFERAGDGFYRVHDFLDWNPSKESIDEKRRVDRKRKRDKRREDSEQNDTGQSTDSGQSPRGRPNGIPDGHPTESEQTPDGLQTESSPPRPHVARGRAPSEPSRAEPSRAEDPPNPPPGDFRLPRDWDPSASVFVGTSVPEWAHPELLSRFRSYHCNGDRSRSATDWVQSYARWACGEWSKNPPQKPPEPTEADTARDAAQRREETRLRGEALAAEKRRLYAARVTETGVSRSAEELVRSLRGGGN